jgi:hypothetical protein
VSSTIDLIEINLPDSAPLLYADVEASAKLGGLHAIAKWSADYGSMNYSVSNIAEDDMTTGMNYLGQQLSISLFKGLHELPMPLRNDVDIVIPPKKGSTYNKKSEWMRNRNIEEIQCYGGMAWQAKHRYGNRNQSECAIGRYKRILGNKLHAREFKRQQQEAIIGCSILNKMMCITLDEIGPKN